MSEMETLRKWKKTALKRAEGTERIVRHSKSLRWRSSRYLTNVFIRAVTESAEGSEEKVRDNDSSR